MGRELELIDEAIAGNIIGESYCLFNLKKM